MVRLRGWLAALFRRYRFRCLEGNMGRAPPTRAQEYHFVSSRNATANTAMVLQRGGSVLPTFEQVQLVYSMSCFRVLFSPSCRGDCVSASLPCASRSQSARSILVTENPSSHRSKNLLPAGFTALPPPLRPLGSLNGR
jgi:hypothetical protein